MIYKQIEFILIIRAIFELINFSNRALFYIIIIYFIVTVYKTTQYFSPSKI